MIAFLTGRVAAKSPTFALLEVGGVGYKLSMSTPSLAALPSEGDEVTVQTYLYVREDDLSLFGFENESEKDAFEQLLTVSGVGPKVALATLSVLSPGALAAAVASQDVALVSSVPGIGKKTAQRLILELADKLGEADACHGGGARGSLGPANAMAQATAALLAMGFSAPEASSALKGASGDTGEAALLKYALKRLGGGVQR